MKRGFVVAIAGAAIAVAGVSGCSKDEKKAESPVAGDKGTSVAEKSSAKVSIDGKDQKVEGAVVCSEQAGDLMIAIGNATAGIGATIGSGDTVKTVGLGNVDGMALGYTQGTGQGEAKVTKDGKTYKISGTAVGVDMANPMQPANKPFSIEVTCP